MGILEQAELVKERAEELIKEGYPIKFALDTAYDELINKEKENENERK
jgi:hypothetical protein